MIYGMVGVQERPDEIAYVSPLMRMGPRGNHGQAKELMQSS
jgi:hypothetical protein